MREIKVKVIKLVNNNIIRGVTKDYSSDIEKEINNNPSMFLEGKEYFLQDFKVVTVESIPYLILRFEGE